MSKLSKGIGIVSGGLGKFATAVGKAGGGFKGVLAVLGSSAGVWIALAAAITIGAIALVDYASGAKMARKALEGMQKTADKWKDNAAETFYNQNNAGLSFFGMSTDAFKAEGSALKKDSQDWLKAIHATWSDGKKETVKVINDYIASFKTSTDEVRTALKEKQENAKAAGYTSLTEQMQKDLATLDSLDKEISSLLKKRRNKKLTDADKVRLQELIDTRQAIQIKYHLVSEEDGNEGFETIRKKVEAEVARANARGQKDAPVAIYEHAVTASAQGMAAVNKQIDAWYDGEYALIALMTDEAEKQKALSDLNVQYNADRKAAALEYANLLKGIILPVWEQADIQQAGADIDILTQKLALFSATSEADKPKLLEEINQLTAGVNEGSLVEYLGLLTQVQSLMDSGMSEEEVAAMFPEIDFSKQLEQIAAIQAFLSGRESLLPGLASIFSEAIPEEMITLTTDLDMTGAEARWAEFAANPGAITTEAIAQVTKYIEIEGGADKSGLTIDQMIAYVSAYAEATNGADTSALTPEIATAFVKGYQELKEGADVSLLKPDEIVAYVKAYAENTAGVDTSALAPDAITAFVLAYEEITGGASTTTLAPEVIAKITRYEEAEGVVRPRFITTQVSITGYDLKAYRQFVHDNPVEVSGILRLDSAYDNPQDAFLDPNTSFWKDGLEVEASLIPAEELKPETVAVLDKDGTMHILITPELTGSKEAIEQLRTEVAEDDILGVTPLGMVAGLRPTSAMDYVDSAMKRIKSYQDTIDLNGWQKFWATILDGASTDKRVLNNSMINDFGPDMLASLTTYVSELLTAIRNGDAIAEEDYQNLLKIMEFVDGLELTGVGENVVAGIGDAMAAAGWETNAESVAANLEDALNTALVIHSPSVRMHPVGENVAAGIGEGAGAYSFENDAKAAADNAESALMTAFGASVFKPIGIQAMNGLANGIRAGQSGVVSAMRSAANAAVTAAKKALDIHSPSRVFRDEVGRMAMKGFGEGISQESNAQAKTILNAARYLTNAAKEGAIAPTMQTNNRTVNNSSSVNLSGNSFYIRDEQDIYALATEIATLTKRQQRGKGLRMA